MKLKKIESYEAGYGIIKKAAAAASAVALLGGMTACRHSLSGDVEYNPQEYDGNMSVQVISDSDISSDEYCSSENEIFTLEGDVAYLPDDGQN